MPVSSDLYARGCTRGLLCRHRIGKLARDARPRGRVKEGQWGRGKSAEKGRKRFLLPLPLALRPSAHFDLCNFRNVYNTGSGATPCVQHGADKLRRRGNVYLQEYHAAVPFDGANADM